VYPQILRTERVTHEELNKELSAPAILGGSANAGGLEPSSYHIHRYQFWFQKITSILKCVSSIIRTEGQTHEEQLNKELSASAILGGSANAGGLVPFLLPHPPLSIFKCRIDIRATSANSCKIGIHLSTMRGQTYSYW
jgi:hypothetical protein